ncbi:MAG: glycosyltransferase family 9 protein [Acidobacteriota bacterium]|nr:glycosyltransferase family 9 protein [Acidobacteriota bacterium]
MTSVLERLPQGARVALIRLRSLGDCILATPAIQLLKTARPDLRIAVVVEPRWAAVYEGNPDVEATLPPNFRALRAWHSSLVLNLHGGGTSAKLTALSGAKWRAGWARFRHSYLYNVRIARAQEILGNERKVHTAEHAASAVFALGVPVSEVPPAKLFASGGGRMSRYAVIHPFASERAKTWSPANFLDVARLLRNELDLEPVFLGGPGDDLSPFSEFECFTGAPLSATKNLIAAAGLFIGNDSGPAHLAAAFRVPCVVLFGPSDPAIWGPWKTQSAVLQASPLDGIGAGEVVRFARKLVDPALSPVLATVAS